MIGERSARGGLEDREANSATLCNEVTKLTTALQEYQDMVQVRYDILYVEEKTEKQKAVHMFRVENDFSLFHLLRLDFKHTLIDNLHFDILKN